MSCMVALSRMLFLSSDPLSDLSAMRLGSEVLLKWNGVLE